MSHRRFTGTALSGSAWSLVLCLAACIAASEAPSFAAPVSENVQPGSAAETGSQPQRLAALRAVLPSLQADLEAVKSRGQDVSYPRVTFTVLENFIGYAEEDFRRGEVERSLQQLKDLEPMAARLRGELKEALGGQRHFAAVPRWTGLKRPVVKGSSFLAPVRLADGTTVERPVFFTGFGHFRQVVTDMEKWPNYGANIIQVEFGPRQVFPRDGETSDAPMRQMLHTLDRAQEAGVAVCLLISPHYFPQWALAKWPSVRKHRGEGFFQFCLHAPEGQKLLRRFIATAIAPLKDHPALHSICLSNEPVSVEEPCESAKKLWRTWLEKRHGDIARLNARYGAKFASFADVPLPNPLEKRPELPLWLDYIRFNQEFLAGWHKALANAVHAVAPNLPVHAKAMTWSMVNDVDVRFGVDPYLFSRFSDVNGNDSANEYQHNSGDVDFAQGWLLNAMSHDLQRSVLDAPVFNTENHLITDREKRYVPASHVRAVLWQAAVHGQSATTIWVWERSFDPKSDLYGSIMHRPGCTEAVGVANYDLNRAAYEVTALQQAPPQALVLQSVTASVWDTGRYLDCLRSIYAALSFTGLNLGFVTERQLEDGIVPTAPILFVSGVVHLSDAAWANLRKFKGRIVLVGNSDLLGYDEYGRKRQVTLRTETIPLENGSKSSRGLYPHILAKLPQWRIRPDVELRGPDQLAVWGVEWRSAETAEGTVVNLCNYQKTPATVTLFWKGQAIAARDVLTGERVVDAMKLLPLEVRLLRLERPGTQASVCAQIPDVCVGYWNRIIW
jgi:hypothetical protein